VDISLFGFRVGSKGASSNWEEWMDIGIEPVIVKSDRTCLVRVVYRSKDKMKAKSFLGQIENTLRQLMELLEKA